MAGARFVVVRSLVRCSIRLMVVFVMADFLFLLWWAWSETGVRRDGDIAIFLQFCRKQKHRGFKDLLYVFTTCRYVDTFFLLDYFIDHECIHFNFKNCSP